MLVLLDVPVEFVISGIVHYLETNLDPKGKKSPPKAGFAELRPEMVYKEASICLLLYAYAVECVNWNKRDKDPANEKEGKLKQEEKQKALRTLWNNLVNLFKLLMTNKVLTTYCWLYDIIYTIGIQYDPREVADKKVKRSIEDVIVQLTEETATIAAMQGNQVTEESLSLMFPTNPAICDLIDKTPLTEEEKKGVTSEPDILHLKVRKLLPQFDRIMGKDAKGKKIQGVLCLHYLRGYCFITMKSILYDMLEKILGIINKDKMPQVV